MYTISSYGFWKRSALTNIKRDALKYMIWHFSYHMPYKPSTDIIPRAFGPWANMGVSGWFDMWYKKWYMIIYNYYLLFCFFYFVFWFVFWLYHFRHTDSGNEHIDWLNQIKWTTMQIYNIKETLFVISIVWNMHRTVIACDTMCCLLCLRLSCESFIQTRVVVFKQNVPSMITCI